MFFILRQNHCVQALAYAATSITATTSISKADSASLAAVIATQNATCAAIAFASAVASGESLSIQPLRVVVTGCAHSVDTACLACNNIFRGYCHVLTFTVSGRSCSAGAGASDAQLWQDATTAAAQATIAVCIALHAPYAATR